MNILIMISRYDCGRLRRRMGLGPDAYLRAGLLTGLRRAGHEVRLAELAAEEDYPLEVGTSFSLNRGAAGRIIEDNGWADLRILLAGDCNAALGQAAGLARSGGGLIWLDAHGDFNTPETSVTGFVAGMPLATITGRCWSGPAGTIPGFAPLAEEKIIHLGGRDFDPPERAALDDAAVNLVPAEAVRDQGLGPALTPALDRLRRLTDRVFIHLDWDVLDPDEVRANHYRAPGGLSLAQATEAIDLIAAKFTVVDLCLASYDPSRDPDGMIAQAGLQVIHRLAE